MIRDSHCVVVKREKRNFCPRTDCIPGNKTIAVTQSVKNIIPISGGISMASIVQRKNSFSVVYTINEKGKRRQKWETYHTREMAMRRRAQIEMLKEVQKETAQRTEKHSCETISEFMEEYVEIYGRIHWSFGTYTGNCSVIRNYILPNFGTMRFQDFTPRTIAAIYAELLNHQETAKPEYAGRMITPQTLASIHKIMHSAFEQAVLWEYTDRNPFHKVVQPKAYPSTPDMLLPEEIARLMQECSHLFKLHCFMVFN